LIFSERNEMEALPELKKSKSKARIFAVFRANGEPMESQWSAGLSSPS
jgi:hypothetical protein